MDYKEIYMLPAFLLKKKKLEEKLKFLYLEENIVILKPKDDIKEKRGVEIIDLMGEE